LASNADLKKAVLAYLTQHRRTPVTVRTLAQKVRIGGESDYQSLRDLVRSLTDSGVLIADAKGRVTYAAPKKKREQPSGGTAHRLTGVISLLRRGGGMIRPAETDQQYFIPQEFLRTAFDGDTVTIVPLARREAGRKSDVDKLPEAEVLEVVERTTTTVTGRLQKGPSSAFIVPDDERIRKDVYVPREEAARARDGDKVVARLLPWLDEHRSPEGKIIEVLGPTGDARVEVMGVARRFALPLSFPPEVERQAAKFPAVIPDSDLRDRLDLRSSVVVTIDPEDAKDFDDALSLEVLPHGLRRLGVHIADVSHYVREDSPLDAEALARGTSTYLVNEVIPMLPERLSNDLCSLRPKESRLTYSVFMDIGRDGEVMSWFLKKSVIRSAHRFSYEEVQRILESGRGDYVELLTALDKLAKQQTEIRRKAGSLDFDTGETKFKFDAEGFPTHILKKVRLDAHRLVEECMLLANKTVTRLAGLGEELPFIYRVHDLPNPERLADLAEFVKKFGFSLNVKSGVPSRELQKLLDRVKGSEVENLINDVALRSMAKAVYATKNIGHYGLAFRHYTHFTSPIRRYPDLIVHRLLDAYQQGANRKALTALRKRLDEVSAQSSARERAAAEAERASVKVMQVEYMKRHLGDELDGVIAGVTAFGMFIEIDDLLVEGLVPVRDMADDYYVLDEKRYELRGRRRGKRYRLGDSVRVRVTAVKPEAHQIDFSLVD
jgi:ribonuclease R